jgi:hypothetical protein
MCPRQQVIAIVDLDCDLEYEHDEWNEDESISDMDGSGHEWNS